MVAITLRSAKGSPLTIAEMDGNLTALKTAVEAAGGGGSVSSVAGRTGTVVLTTADLSDFLEASQDVTGAMIAAAGGTYNDGAGTITLPSSGGGQASDATLTALAALTGAGVVTATATDAFAMRSIGAASTSDIPDRAAADARYAAISAVTAPVPQVEVAAGNTLALVQATHQGATITLSGTGATFTANATTLGNGFAFVIKNRTGADFTVPPFTGATREYAKAASHTKIASGSDAALEIYTRNGAMFASIMGDTL